MQVLMAHRESPIPSLCQDRPDVPPPLDAAYQKMVAKEPLERYQTMSEVITALESCVGKRSTPATTAAEERTATFPAEDPLSFLQEASPRPLATAARKQVERRPAATFSQQVAVEETSSRGGRANPLAVARRKKLRAVAIGLGLLAVVGMIAWAVIITVTKNGKKTEVEVPDGATAKVAPDGKVEVTLPGKADGDGTRKVLGTEYSVPSTLPLVASLIGPDGKWKLPPGAPPPAIAPFDAKKAKEHQAVWAKYLGLPVEVTNSIGMKLVLIPPGEFEMGSSQELIEEELKTAPKKDNWYLEHLPGEGPRHHVRITRPFYLGMYPVTQEEYQHVMGASPSEFSATGKSKDKVAGLDTKRFPAEMVTWTDADEFCSRLSEMAEEKSAGRYRLPSEAQWEYACRAGSTGRWFFSPASDEKKAAEALLPDYAWFSNNSGWRPHPVGGRRASPWGLYDIYGNVWQWCQDWHANDYYAKSPTNDPAGPPGGSHRVDRGGSWDYPAGRCRSAQRDDGPGHRNFDHGFRVSRVLAEE